MKNIKSLYYAHHMFKYNTEEEKKELNLISEKFNNYYIINPNGFICQENDEKSIMNQCLHFVKNNSDILVFSTIEDQIMGKGVYDEIKCALQDNKTVYYLYKDNFSEFTKEYFDNILIIHNESGSNRYYGKIFINDNKFKCECCNKIEKYSKFSYQIAELLLPIGMGEYDKKKVVLCNDCFYKIMNKSKDEFYEIKGFNEK